MEEKLPRVLVACPTFEGHRYCIDEFLAGVKALTYKNFDLLLVDNSKGTDYLDLLKSKGVRAIKSGWFEGAMDRIVHSRNVIKDIVLKEGYDYFLSLEQDVIPDPDTIQKMLRHKKEIVSAVVLIHHVIDGKRKTVPMIYVDSSIHKGKLNYIHPSELKKPQLILIRACALACVIVHRDVLKDITFRYTGGADDMMFCKDVQEKSHNLYVDTTIRTHHKTRSWEGIKK